MNKPETKVFYLFRATDVKLNENDSKFLWEGTNTSVNGADNN